MRRFLPDAFTLTLIATVIRPACFPPWARGVVHAGRQQRGDLAAVFPAWGAAVHRRHRGGREGPAPACPDPGLHLRAVPAAGTRAARAVPGAADAGAVAGRAVCLHAVLHGAVVHRLHVHGARQRARRHLRGHRFEPAGHGADAAAGGRAAAPPGRRSRLADAGRILLQLLLPFALGSLLRPWIGAWAQRNSRVLSKVDRSSILLAVYTAFSEAVAQGIWHAFPPLDRPPWCWSTRYCWARCC